MEEPRPGFPLDANEKASPEWAELFSCLWGTKKMDLRF